MKCLFVCPYVCPLPPCGWADGPKMWAGGPPNS